MTDRDWLARLDAITPMGSQTRSKGPDAYGRGLVPAYAVAGHGAILECDDRDLIDWVCGLGAISLGYRHPLVDGAVKYQMDRGVSFSLPTMLEAEVGERLRALVPCMQPDGMVRFVKTGSEATEAAIRIARKATGRNLILCVDGQYHGWHSWHAATKPDHPGVPQAYTTLVRTFRYNDLASLMEAAQLSATEDDLYRGAPGDHIAAVIMEPTLFIPPAPGFLEGVRAFCDRHGIVLIFDEMVCGFRLAIAGGQERFGVTPDLATYGKGLANGWPLACVCGKKELMIHADVVSGTFGGEAVSLTAAETVLRLYERDRVCQHLHDTGVALWQAIERSGLLALGFAIEGWPPVGRLVATGADAMRKLALVTHTLAQCGMLWHPRIFYVCQAHEPQHVARTAAALQIAAERIVQAQRSGDWSAIESGLPADPFVRTMRT